MDSVVVHTLLIQANASVQITMSMVCKQWAAVAWAYSMQYKTIGQATRADCSLAISRIITVGRRYGGGGLEKILNKHKYITTGNSIHFARFVGSRLRSMIPYCFISLRGTKYVDWLEANGKVPAVFRPKTLRALARGCKKAVASCGGNWKNWHPEIAAVLYLNGHHNLCWPLSTRERGILLRLAKWLEPDVLFGLIDGQTMITNQILSRLTCEQIAAVLHKRGSLMGRYLLNDPEKARLIHSVSPVTEIYLNGFPYGDNTFVWSPEKAYSKTQNVAVFGDAGIVQCLYWIRVQTENIEELESVIYRSDLELRCVAGHVFHVMGR
jgi:hypothetical protein